MTIRERLESNYKVNRVTGCWEWTKYRKPNGYGQVKYGGKKHMVHRLSYEVFNGPIPDGLIVRHTCDNPCCYNPEHLLLGTHADNMEDKVTRGRASSKLTAEQVDAIKSDTRSLRVIAKEYGVHHATISHIKTGRNWKHLN